MKRRSLAVLFLLPALLAFGAGCRSTAPSAPWTGSGPFLSRADLPNVVNYLPPPPEPDDPLFAADRVRHEWGKTFHDGPRAEQARLEASIDPVVIAARFEPALGFSLDPAALPETCRLLDSAVATAVRAGKNGKEHYQRPRPYLVTGDATLLPELENLLRKNGSFPSGHSARGWSLALLLVELFPAHQDEILRVGYEYGQSRVIAGYHWQSDVDAGRLSAAAAVARLHADPAFLEQLARARAEIAAAGLR